MVNHYIEPLRNSWIRLAQIFLIVGDKAGAVQVRTKGYLTCTQSESKSTLHTLFLPSWLNLAVVPSCGEQLMQNLMTNVKKI